MSTLQMIKFKEFEGKAVKNTRFRAVPEVLYDFSHKIFGKLSRFDRELYGHLRNQFSISLRYGRHIDDFGKAFVEIPVSKACHDLSCSKPTVIRALKHLEELGLISRIKRGAQRPDMIYVYDCDNMVSSQPENSQNFTSSGKEILPQEVKKFDRTFEYSNKERKNTKEYDSEIKEDNKKIQLDQLKSKLCYEALTAGLDVADIALDSLLEILGGNNDQITADVAHQQLVKHTKHKTKQFLENIVKRYSKSAQKGHIQNPKAYITACVVSALQSQPKKANPYKSKQSKQNKTARHPKEESIWYLASLPYDQIPESKMALVQEHWKQMQVDQDELDEFLKQFPVDD